MSEVGSVIQLFESPGDGEITWAQVGHSQMSEKPGGFNRGLNGKGN